MTPKIADFDVRNSQVDQFAVVTAQERGHLPPHRLSEHKIFVLTNLASHIFLSGELLEFSEKYCE